MAKTTRTAAPVETSNDDVITNVEPNTSSDVQTEQNEIVNGEQQPDQTPDAPQAEPIPLIDQLRAKYTEQLTAMVGMTVGSKEQKDMMLEAFKTDKLISAELVNIENKKRDAELVEKRNARIAMVDELLEAVREEQRFYFGTFSVLTDDQKAEPANIEAMNVYTNRIKELREPVVNELLARYATSTPAAKLTIQTDAPADGTAAQPKGSKGKEILDMFLKNREVNPGITDAANKALIVKAGHAVGTVGSVILAWERANGIKP